jgi:hypothetical protein
LVLTLPNTIPLTDPMPRELITIKSELRVAAAERMASMVKPFLIKVADRLQEYAAKRCQTSEDRIFPFSYEEDTAGMMAAKAG